MCQNKIFEKMKISLTRKLCQKEIPRVSILNAVNSLSGQMSIVLIRLLMSRVMSGYSLCMTSQCVVWDEAVDNDVKVVVVDINEVVVIVFGIMGTHLNPLWKRFKKSFKLSHSTVRQSFWSTYFSINNDFNDSKFFSFLMTLTRWSKFFETTIIRLQI